MSNRPLQGRVMLVTGASEGIGRATALALGQAGAHVVMCARREAPLAEAEAAVRAAGGAAEAHRLDVADLDAYAALIHDVAVRHGRLDGLVNNAMAAAYAPLLDLDIDAWRRDFAVNAEAVFVGTREALRLMQPAGRGSIVNIASACGIRAAAGMASYSASKAALIHFSACAAVEAAPFGVRVNCIVPGQIATPATEAFSAMMPDQAAATVRAIPMRRSGEPREIAETVLFLLSDGSTYISGTALPVDGGKAVQLYLPEVA